MAETDGGVDRFERLDGAQLRAGLTVFADAVEAVGVPAGSVLSVGDNLVRDVLAALEHGMQGRWPARDGGPPRVLVRPAGVRPWRRGGRLVERDRHAPRLRSPLDAASSECIPGGRVIVGAGR